MRPIADLELRAALDYLESHTLACHSSVPDPSVAVVRYECSAQGVDLDTTTKAVATLDASSDGHAVYRIAGQEILQDGRPDDDMAVGFFANVLGALPFGGVEQPEIVNWVHDHVATGGRITFRTLTISLSGPPEARQVSMVAATE